MHEEKTHGIVLRSLNYKDNQRIITLFTPLGLLSVIVKRISSRSPHLLALTTPFCEGEFLFKRGRSDLFSFLDGTVIDAHYLLRQHLSSLQTAGGLAQAILSSQLDGKSSADLYQLFCFYLKRVPSFTSPNALLASFQLKLLTQEGLLSLSSACNRCKDKEARFLSKGESLCEAHPLEESFNFSSEEWGYLLRLQQARHFSALEALVVPGSLSQKITLFFKYRAAQQ